MNANEISQITQWIQTHQTEIDTATNPVADGYISQADIAALISRGAPQDTPASVSQVATQASVWTEYLGAVSATQPQTTQGPYLSLNALNSGAGGTATITTPRTPFMEAAADPHIYQKDGQYYFLFTTGDGVWVRSASDLNQLPTAEPKKVWGWNEEIKGHVWAPEIAQINGKWYIYASGSLNPDIPDMRMFVLEADTNDPLGNYSYKGLLSDKQAIDQSVWQDPQTGQLWMTWSQWDPDQSIFIAKMKSPTEIDGVPVKISSPTNAWEGVGQPVNEGPQFLRYGDKMHIVFSASHCATPDYALATLTADANANWLDPASWKKSTSHVFSQNPSVGAYGTGHHSTFQSPDGQWWLAYHATSNPKGANDASRSTRVQPFSFDANGMPVFGTPNAQDPSTKT
ncbi:MAG: hypothetical protein RIR70_1353 [Pseudomonadota bacterium]|jgi:GH43 family beta-xylosidase